MKNRLPFILLLVILFSTTQSIKAQYVTIPDANFRSYLTSNFSSCMNGSGQLDTTCSSILNTKIIYLTNQKIHNLSGIQYFKSLTNLYCGDSLTNLPALPASLTYLDCSGNQLTSLPALPASLTTLYCYENSLTDLPVLPASLTALYCYENSLTNLPALPTSLTTLDCDQNQLTSLPALPTSLTTLECGENQLTSLPALPASLTTLE